MMDVSDEMTTKRLMENGRDILRRPQINWDKGRKKIDSYNLRRGGRVRQDIGELNESDD
jgi:hypothetical protein